MTMMSTTTSNTNNNNVRQFGDTTLTKVFVGGLAWETPKEALRDHFEKYGEILEAVIISDKLTARSKGYGFVTFKEVEAAKKACEDQAALVINGRRANCNLASIGARRPRSCTASPPPYPQPPQGDYHYHGGLKLRSNPQKDRTAEEQGITHQAPQPITCSGIIQWEHLLPHSINRLFLTMGTRPRTLQRTQITITIRSLATAAAGPTSMDTTCPMCTQGMLLWVRTR